MAEPKGLNVDVPRELAVAFKTMVTARETTMRKAMAELLQLYLSMQADETGRTAFSDILRVWTAGKEARRREVANAVRTVRLNVDHEAERAERATKQMPVRKSAS